MLTTQEHANEARLSARRMTQDVADGLLLQASNQAWHATKHAVNAVAVSRRLNPVKYPEKRKFLSDLADEPGNSAVLLWMEHPWRLHGNADQGFMPADRVADAVQATDLLISCLLAIADNRTGSS